MGSAFPSFQGVIDAYNELITPAKVIINEYTNIASSFFSNSEVNFVNGILDVLAKEFRPTEFNKQ